MAKKQIVDPVINDLLTEFKQQRDELKTMVADVEKLKVQVENLFPEKIDNRYARLFEEKVKSATGFFNVLLDIRKELIKSLSTEIEVRRKIDTGDDNDLESLLDIRKIAKKVENLSRKKESLKVVTPEKDKQETKTG
jgi:hypothetical protein